MTEKRQHQPPLAEDARPTDAARAAGLSFGPFELDVGTGELLRAGKPVKLQQQPFKVLTLLAQQPGRLVTRGEIQRHLWGENTFVDFERGLNFAMVQIRAALEDSSGKPRFIETLPRRGYRLIAPVSSRAELPPSEGDGKGATFHSRRVPRRWWWVSAAAVLVAAVGFSIQTDPGPEALQAPARQTIVVLPFKNLGPAEDRFFADGMAEEITSRLAAVRGLGVISRTSADQYAGASKTASQIGDELGVDYVLEGAVQWERRQSGPSRVRITPQLIRVPDDVHVWSRVYTRDLVEIFRLQTELAEAVVGELDVELQAWEQGALETRPTENLEAYQAYLRGLDAAARYSGADTRLAVQMFQRAVELDPGFALAHARLSYQHGLVYHEGDRTEARREEARKAAERALRLDPDLPRAHLALGYYHYWGHRDYAQALTEFSLARRGLPNDSQLLLAIGAIRRRQGRMDEAVAEMRRALELNPRHADTTFELALTLAMMREYDSAGALLDRAISLAPDYVRVYESKACQRIHVRDLEAARRVMDAAPGPRPSLTRAWLEYLAGDYQTALRLVSSCSDPFWYEPVPKTLFEAHVHDAMGEPELARRDYEAALGTLEREARKRPNDPFVHSALGITYAGLGRREEAIAQGKRAVAIVHELNDAVETPTAIADLARIHAQLGQPDAALDRLEQLLTLPAGLEISAPLLELDPAFRSLRDHPRYSELLRRLASSQL